MLQGIVVPAVVWRLPRRIRRAISVSRAGDGVAHGDDAVTGRPVFHRELGIAGPAHPFAGVGCGIGRQDLHESAGRD